MRDHFGPTALLLSRVPLKFLENKYSIMLPETDEPSAVNLLTALAFMRGFMSSSGIPDCSRAARLLSKDVVNGRIRWVAAPPGVDQEIFDATINESEAKSSTTGRVQLAQLEKRGLLNGASVANRRVDANFFDAKPSVPYVKTGRASIPLKSTGTVVPAAITDSGPSSKKHYNKNKKEKIRRLYVESC